jgi:hypothetical protein
LETLTKRKNGYYLVMQKKWYLFVEDAMKKQKWKECMNEYEKRK